MLPAKEWSIANVFLSSTSTLSAPEGQAAKVTLPEPAAIRCMLLRSQPVEDLPLCFNYEMTDICAPELAFVI